MKTTEKPRATEADNAERVVVGALLISPEYLPVVAASLTPADFQQSLCRDVYQAIQALDESQQAIDFLTVRRQLAATGSVWDSRPLEISALIDGIPRVSNVEAYAGIVLEAATLRRVAAAAQEVIRVTESGDTAEAVLNKAQAIMLAIGEGRKRGRGLESIREAMLEVQQDFEAAVKGEQVGAMSYGLIDLDAQTGGMHNGDFVVIGARPSVGKSALAFHVARVAARANAAPVAIFSVEMARRQVASRMLACDAMVDMTGFRGGAMTSTEWEALSEAMKRAIKWPVWIDDAGTISVVEIAARARRLKADKGLSIVIVDYLQLVRAPKAENRTQEVGAISRGLKTLAKDLNVPVLALAQLNRSAEGVRPLLSHLRESGDIEADADAVLFLWRPDEEKKDELEIIVAKQRNGPTGTIPVYFRREHQRFENAAKDEVYGE